MAHPDRADPAGGDEDALLAQLVGDPDLAVGRIFDGVGDNRVLGFEIDPVLEIGRPAWTLQQRLDTAVLDRIPLCSGREINLIAGADELSSSRLASKASRALDLPIE